MLKPSIRLASLAAAALLLQGCLSMKSYVDPALPKAGKADVASVANPQPVQALFEFRTRGSTSAGGGSVGAWRRLRAIWWASRRLIR